MTTPTQQTLAHMKQLGEEAAAKFYDKTPGAIRVILKTKKVTGQMVDKYYESLVPPEPGSTINATYSEVGLDSNEVNGKLNDLHLRTSELETQMLEVIAQLASRSLKEVNSAVRPQGQVYGHQVISEPEPPPDAPIRVQGTTIEGRTVSGVKLGIASGIAPTREQARGTNEGPRGKPAQPAKPRVLQPDQPGQWDWNLNKDQMKAKKEGQMQRIRQNAAQG